MTSPNINTRVKLQLQSNIKQPQAETRKFSVDDPILVRDLRPGQHPKWQKGTVTAVLGGPRYQVNVDGQHTREAHVDHLQPGVHTEVQAEPVSNPVESPEGELAMSRAISPRRSSRQVIPTKRLLEEV